MLKKLCKHEWKNTSRFGVLILLILLGVTVLGVIAFQTPFWRSIGNDLNTMDSMNPIAAFFTALLSITALMVYGFVAFGVSLGILIYVSVSFYKSMFTDQGYLTHTLPVETKDLLISKGLIGGVWQLIIRIATILSVMIVGISFLYAVDGEFSLEALMTGFIDVIGTAIKILTNDVGFNPVAMIVIFVLWGIVSPFATVVTVYGACSLGQLAGKSKIFLSIVYYFGIQFAIRTLGDIVRFVFSVLFVATDDLTESGFVFYLNSTAYTDIVLRVLVAGLLGFISYRIVKNRLNLE